MEVVALALALLLMLLMLLAVQVVMGSLVEAVGIEPTSGERVPRLLRA